MSKKTLAHLSRRERQIMDVIYRAGRATAAIVSIVLGSRILFEWLVV